MLAHALQDVDEVVVRIDVMQPARGQQALDDADVFGAQFGPCEQPIAAAHGNDAQCPLKMIRVDRHVGIVEVNLKARSPFADIGQCGQERAAR